MHRLLDKTFAEIIASFPAAPSNLYDPLRYALSSGGKRLRPFLVMSSAGLFSENISPAVPSAIAVELFHNFTLLHDDIMDNASLRRGNPSVHVKWNTNIAILSGDALYTEAFRQLGRSPENVLKELTEIFSATSLHVCEGQQMDMDFEKKNNISIAEYLRMIELKTAVLLAACLEMGAVAVGAEKKEAEKLSGFGKHMGIAFQLKDDILDVYGHSEKFGKQPGGDIVSNKKTFLLLKAYELANRYQKEELQNWTQAGAKHAEEKVIAIKNIFDSLEVRRHAEKEMRAHYEKGIVTLESVKADKEKITALRKFADDLMNREY
ncbi:MAG: polyprenyl synthetase family protein [Bacteroidetes bacterium]|nr:polyprenyl synthetase family protein [Bacteroidota bacterium]